MTVNPAPRSQKALKNAFAAPRTTAFSRTALFAAGAATGLLASALAGFGIVGLMFPNAGLPGTGGAPMSAAAYLTAPVSVEVMPAARVAVAPVTAPSASPLAAPVLVAPLDEPAPVAAPVATPVEVAVTEVEASVSPSAGAETGATTSAAVAPDATPAAPATPPAAPVVVASKSAPAAATPDPEIDTSSFGPRIAMLPPQAAAAPASAASGPEAFATLSEADAAARAGAGLFAERSSPAAAPETEAVDPTIMAAARPARRPEGLADQVAAAAPADVSAAPASSIRPAPRPEIVRAAAAAPAPAPTAAPAAATPAPTNVVPVAARQSTGGFLSRGTSSCGRTLARAIPTRRGGDTGSAFFAGLGNAWGPARDAEVVAELARGNMPRALRNLQPVTFTGQDARGQATEITICVTPDYLALGSDKDYVRVPLGLPAASRIAGAFNMTLPTPKMVDAIYAQAAVRLSPKPMQAGPQMQSTDYLLRHNATIAGQLAGRGGLIAGHKKDVVMASRMASAPGRVAIYGWHRSNGAPIQPVSTVHGAEYADYSHGVRLVSKTAYLNGKPVSLDELLASSRYAYLLNSDGPMPGPVIRTASR